MSPGVGTFSFFSMCFILSWVEMGRNRQISIFFTLTDMITSDGFYLAQVYCIIHNRIPIMKWMNITIHSKQMHIKWQAPSHCLLYAKEISAKFAAVWHDYISQFAKDSHPSITTISSQFLLYSLLLPCCPILVLLWLLLFLQEPPDIVKQNSLSAFFSCSDVSLSVSFSDKQ